MTCIGESQIDAILDIEEICESPLRCDEHHAHAAPVPWHEHVRAPEAGAGHQDGRTALTLDSFYQSVNRIKVVQEGQVNIDDLLVNRPGGIIRAKGHNAVRNWAARSSAARRFSCSSTPTCRSKARVGVSPDMAGQNNLVNNESAHGVERMMSAKEMLVNLMVRNRRDRRRPAYRMIRDLMVRYQNGMVPFKFKGNWVNVDPSTWGDRSAA